MRGRVERGPERIPKAREAVEELIEALGSDRVYDLIQKAMWVEDVLGSPMVELLRRQGNTKLRLVIDLHPEDEEAKWSQPTAEILLGPTLARPEK